MSMLANIRGYIQAYYRKATKKLFGVVHLKGRGRRKETVLLSFITSPFTLPPGGFFTDPHSNYWVAPEIAHLLLERGYDVDVIEWNDDHFVPKKKYAACIDLHHHLKRFAPHLDPDCIKILFTVSAHPAFQNTVEEKRIKALEKRRGITLPPTRKEPLSENEKYADYIAGYGNAAVLGTYAGSKASITPIPIPAMDTYDFPAHKDWDTVRTHFLWFGGGGAILKGLDLVLEAFASLPHLHLTIIGPSAYEKEFEAVYARELALPNITRLRRPRRDEKGDITIDGRDLKEIFDQCGAVVYMSASEGGGGAVVHAMQAGLFPIVTPNTGIDESAPSVIIADPTVDAIRKAVEEYANLPVEKLEASAREVWQFAKSHHTKETFTKSFGDFLDHVVKLP